MLFVASRVGGEEDRALGVMLLKDIKICEEKSTKSVSSKKLKAVSWNVAYPGFPVAPLYHRNELAALPVPR